MNQRTLVIGDIHGCARELEALVSDANPTHLVLVGDLFTRGPFPDAVWEFLASWDREKKLSAVLGNHDQHLLDAMDGTATPSKRIQNTITALNGTGTTWIKWLIQRPTFLTVGAFTVVHAGLHPHEGRAGTSNEMARNMRYWPYGQKKGPLWHANYTAQDRVIFGHDARRGVVRIEKNDLPWIIGLDSGCVYGGRLSGYLIEEDRLYSVRAYQMYVDPSRTKKPR